MVISELLHIRHFKSKVPVFQGKVIKLLPHVIHQSFLVNERLCIHEPLRIFLPVVKTDVPDAVAHIYVFPGIAVMPHCRVQARYINFPVRKIYFRNVPFA